MLVVDYLDCDELNLNHFVEARDLLCRFNLYMVMCGVGERSPG